MNLNNKMLDISLFGESHGKYVGATLTGLPSGVRIDKNVIDRYLNERRPNKNYETNRIENDEYEFISGVNNNYSNGNPITIIIKNGDVKDESELLARPSHGDYETYLKNGVYADLRGGGISSGRLTAPLVALGSIVIEFLKTKNVYLHAQEEINEELLLKASKTGDSVGGIVEVKIEGIEKGLGGNLFDSLESKIARAVLSLPGIKGIEFGLGFKFANYLGSEVNDQFKKENEKIIVTSNNSGGINAGITNGENITFNAIFKPTPTIAKEQNYLNLKNMVVETKKICSRNDTCIARRGKYAILAITAIQILDAYMEKYGSEYLK